MKPERHRALVLLLLMLGVLESSPVLYSQKFSGSEEDRVLTFFSALRPVTFVPFVGPRRMVFDG